MEGIRSFWSLMPLQPEPLSHSLVTARDRQAARSKPSLRCCFSKAFLALGTLAWGPQKWEPVGCSLKRAPAPASRSEARGEAGAREEAQLGAPAFGPLASPLGWEGSCLGQVLWTPCFSWTPAGLASLLWLRSDPLALRGAWASPAEAPEGFTQNRHLPLHLLTQQAV